MSLLRNSLLRISRSTFLKTYLPEFYFVKKAVKRFMPGEKLSEAIGAAQKLNEQNIGIVFTYLGENLNSISEAETVKDHYIEVLNNISLYKLNAEISVKLTQLGLDISFDKAIMFFKNICLHAKEINNFVWIDMEDSSYTEKTINFYNSVHKEFPNTGICLQAYLKRTQNDIINILDNNASIRLVKGAYKESENVVFQKKSEVDENYLAIADILLNNSINKDRRIVFGTHDLNIINKIKNYSDTKPEFHLLYGIKSSEQLNLVKDGFKVKTLISYGDAWFPWYMRRLAERPANVWFVLRNIFSG